MSVQVIILTPSGGRMEFEEPYKRDVLIEQANAAELEDYRFVPR